MTLDEFAERCRKLPEKTVISVLGDSDQVSVMLLKVPGGFRNEIVEPGQSITEAVERLLTLAETGKEQA